MADASSIKVVKTIAFKDGIQEWSNRYHFSAGSPINDTRWTALSDAVVAIEKAVYPSYVEIVRTFGYDGGSDVAAFQKDYSLAGTLTGLTGPPQASEVVALCRFTTDKRSSKNHPVYLFNYWHGVYTNSLPDLDKLETLQHTAFATYADAWVSGFSDGTTVHHRTGPDETPATGALVETYVTHRDFR